MELVSLSTCASRAGQTVEGEHSYDSGSKQVARMRAQVGHN